MWFQCDFTIRRVTNLFLATCWSSPCFDPDWPFQAWQSKSPSAGSHGCNTAGWSSLRPKQRPWRPHRALVHWNTAPLNQGAAASGGSCKSKEELVVWADAKDWAMIVAMPQRSGMRIIPRADILGPAEHWCDQGQTSMTVWHSLQLQLSIRGTMAFPLEVPLKEHC